MVQQPVAVPVDGGVAPPAQQVVAYDYAEPHQRRHRAPRAHRGGVGPEGLRVGPRQLQGRRLWPGAGPGRPGARHAARRPGAARVPRPRPVRAEAVRRGRGGRVRRALGRAGLGLGHPGGPLPERGRLHRPPPGPGGVRQAEPDRGGAPVPARLLLPRPGAQGGGRRQVRQGGAAPAGGQALGQARRGAGPRRQAARPARHRRHDGPHPATPTARPRRPRPRRWRVRGSPGPTRKSRSPWSSSPTAPSPGP